MRLRYQRLPYILIIIPVRYYNIDLSLSNLSIFVCGDISDSRISWLLLHQWDARMLTSISHCFQFSYSVVSAAFMYNKYTSTKEIPVHSTSLGACDGVARYFTCVLSKYCDHCYKTLKYRSEIHNQRGREDPPPKPLPSRPLNSLLEIARCMYR